MLTNVLTAVRLYLAKCWRYTRIFFMRFVSTGCNPSLQNNDQTNTMFTGIRSVIVFRWDRSFPKRTWLIAVPRCLRTSPRMRNILCFPNKLASRDEAIFHSFLHQNFEPCNKDKYGLLHRTDRIVFPLFSPFSYYYYSLWSRSQCVRLNMFCG